MRYSTRSVFRRRLEYLRLNMGFNKGTEVLCYLQIRKAWLFVSILFLLFVISGCGKKSIGLSKPNTHQEVADMQQGEIIDSVGSNELFEERKALWLKKMPTHYKLSFAFVCDCPHRTTQLREAKKDGELFLESYGNFLTVEVKDGKVVGIQKEDGEHIPIKEYRKDKLQPDAVEYSWNIGKNESYGYKLLSEPIGFLWRKAQEAIRSQPQKKLILTYDKKFGFIKKIDFFSSIPDNYFQGEIKHFTLLD